MVKNLISRGYDYGHVRYVHDDFENPPDLPAFRNETPKKAKRESLSDALTGAAVAFAHVFKGRTSHVYRILLRHLLLL